MMRLPLLLLVLLMLLPVASSSAPGSPESPIRKKTVIVPVTSSTTRTTFRGGAITAKVAATSPKTAVAPAATAADATNSLQHKLKVGFYFGLWYALNVYYNIINKKVLNTLPAPMIVGTIQLAVGAVYVLLLWNTGLRAAPVVQPAQRAGIRSVGLWHAVGQLASMVSLGAGPVSFTHIVKALEPFFSAIVSALCFGKWMKLPVYASLIPVVGGVGYACLKERSFSWLAFAMAMLSNLAFALRAVLSKVAMTAESSSKNMTPANIFGLVTIASFFLSVPMALAGEAKNFLSLWESALKQYATTADLYKAIIVSGLVHYLNNEVMYLALGNVHPVTLAVGNTMKRVFILVASVMVFRNPISLQAGIGSAIGIGGVFLYSLTKEYYEKLEAKEQAAKKDNKKTVTTTKKR